MSTDRHDPLDADERELARVLRALPAGEPSSALDARILATARDAVVTQASAAEESRRRRAPRLAWGLGVAASGVLAAGLVWRMGGFGGEALDVIGSEMPAEVAADAPATAPVQPAPPMPEAESEHIAVEIGGPRAAPRPTLAPPLPPPAAPARQRAMAEPSDASAAQASEQRREQARAPALRPDPVAEDAPPAPAAAPPVAADGESPALDRIVVTGTHIDADAARPVAEDGKAGAQAWIQRIRARIARGDEDGARASLEAFVTRHPGKPLPQDLIDFRQRHAGD